VPVDSNTFKVVFCEGRPGSLDYLLLNQILPVGQVRIRPVGGKFGLRAYIQGYLATYPEDAQPAYIAFRDRDFDVEPPEAPQLIAMKDEYPLWMSHRAAIENYLIDAELLRQYWLERENSPRWTHGPALSIDEIQDHVRESARELTNYQAVRWALAKLKPGIYWPRIRTTWTRHGSGDLPLSLGYDDCLADARQLVVSFQDQIQDVHPGRLQEYAETYRQRFNDNYFLEGEHGYLVWFHGKDHLVQLCRRLAPNFPQRHYADWAAEQVDVGNHPDLQQLVDLAS
jgi:hypothetical protein